MKPFLAPLIAVLGATFGTASLAHAEVLTGLATPLSGHMAWAGASDQVGAESAVADLNAKGGVLGERIELTVVDDACDPEQAVVAAEKLVYAGVALVVGHRCSIARFRPRESTPRPES